MTDDEFDEFVADSSRDLDRKQADLGERFGLGRHARWDYDQAAGLLTFADACGRIQIEAEVVNIGSFSTKSQTWRWAWANSSVPEAVAANPRGYWACLRRPVWRCSGWSLSTPMRTWRGS